MLTSPPRACAAPSGSGGNFLLLGPGVVGVTLQRAFLLARRFKRSSYSGLLALPVPTLNRRLSQVSPGTVLSTGATAGSWLCRAPR
jgi:hypothetical protein